MRVGGVRVDVHSVTSISGGLGCVPVSQYLSEAPCSMSETLRGGQQAGWDGVLLQLSYGTHGGTQVVREQRLHIDI